MLRVPGPEGLTTIKAPPAADSEPNRDLPAAFRLYWRMILAAVAGALLIGILSIVTSPSVYQATARLLFDPRHSDNVRPNPERELGQVSIDASQIENQIQLIRSERVYRTVIAAQGLDRDPEFTRPRLSLRSLLHWWTTPAAERKAGYSTVVNQFDQQLDVRRLGQSYVLQVSFQSTDPDKAARLANAVTAAYVGHQLAPRIEQARRTGQFERPIQELGADAAVVAEALKTGVIDVNSFPAVDARVITAALAPSGRSSPRSSLILGLSGALGLLTGGVAALVRYRFAKVICDPAQIDSMLGVTCLGTIGELDESFTAMNSVVTNGVAAWGVNAIVDQPTAVFSTQIRQVRTSFEMSLRSSTGQCIGVTSALRGEGKSLIAYHLALAFAAAGRRTLLIDANSQNPTLTRAVSANLARRSEDGLHQAMATGDPDPIILRTLIRQLWFMPVGRHHEWLHFSDLTDTPVARDLFDRLRTDFDRVVVDLAAFSVLPDAWAMGSLLDSYILVIESGRTGQVAARDMVSALGMTTAGIAGAVLNERSPPPNTELWRQGIWFR
jgi:polysaccharide biosynthesis transport protein